MNERGDVMIDPTEIKRIGREYYNSMLINSIIYIKKIISIRIHSRRNNPQSYFA